MLPPQWEHDFDKSAIFAKPLEEEFLGAILEPKIDENRARKIHKIAKDRRTSRS